MTDIMKKINIREQSDEDEIGPSVEEIMAYEPSKKDKFFTKWARYYEKLDEKSDKK